MTKGKLTDLLQIYLHQDINENYFYFVRFNQRFKGTMERKDIYCLPEEPIKLEKNYGEIIHRDNNSQEIPEDANAIFIKREGSSPNSYFGMYSRINKSKIKSPIVLEGVEIGSLGLESFC